MTRYCVDNIIFQYIHIVFRFTINKRKSTEFEIVPIQTECIQILREIIVYLCR